MHKIKVCLILLALIGPIACISGSSAPRVTRVLFVGNSITYYHGVPYLFSEISSDVYRKPVIVDYLVQPGGHLSEVLANSATVAELKRAHFDVVILQEWGSQLLCGATASGRDSPSCKASLNAHRVLAETAGGDQSTRILLGSHQPREQVARALLAGERWFVNTLEFDRHAPVAAIFLNGESELPGLRWRAEDGIHPGSALALAIAFVAAEAAFDSISGEYIFLDIFEAVETPKKRLSYQTVETDLSVFHTDKRSALPSSVIESIRSSPKDIHGVGKE